MTSVTAGLEERLLTVRAGIADACAAVGRDASEMTLIVVTKFHSANLVRELAALGVRDVGENRHQEAQVKAAELADLDLNWHFWGSCRRRRRDRRRSTLPRSTR